MDPLSLVGSLITGGASLFGGAMSNAASAQQAQQANQLNVMQNLEGQAFNAQQQTSQNAFQTGSQQKAMDFASQMQQTQMDYETKMSNTAYQRAVTGMKAAGLNPLLSAGTGGASTPQVSSPTVSPMSGGAATSPGFAGAQQAKVNDLATPAVATALQAYKTKADVDNTNQSTTVQERQASNIDAQTDLTNAKTWTEKINQRIAAGNAAAASLAPQEAMARIRAANSAADASSETASIKHTYGGDDVWNPSFWGRGGGAGISWLSSHDPLSAMGISPSMPPRAPDPTRSPYNPAPQNYSNMLAVPKSSMQDFGVMTWPKDKQWGGVTIQNGLPN